MKICLTIDADWAIPPVREFAFDLLRRERIPFTYFATSDQHMAAEAFCEIAWHPNPDEGLERSFENLSALFPLSRGMRPHRAGGMAPQDLITPMRRFHLHWASVGGGLNQVTAQRLDGGHINFPISWGDNYLFTSNTEPDWSLLRSSSTGYYIMNFHPIHLFLNTDSVERYREAKRVYKSFPDLQTMVNEHVRGVRDLFLKTLELKQDRAVHFMTLSEACDELLPEN